MEELVKIIQDEPFTDSIIIANGTGNEHESVVALLKNYQLDFLEFGIIEFTDLKSGKRGRPTRVYQLNEQQATLLMTYLGNNEVVRKFKKELVRQFYQMKQYILEHQSLQWQNTRIESKTNRRMETDEIKLFVAYAKEHGSQHADKYYMAFTKLANQILEIPASSRDALTVSQLNNLILIEHIIGEVIKAGIRRDLFYKDIYLDCKIRLGQFKEITYLAVGA